MTVINPVELGHRTAVLQSLANDYNCSVDSLVLAAVDSFIEQAQSQIAYEQRAVLAYKQYQETKRHITLDEFSTWVESLDADKPLKDMPVCHK